MPDYRSKTTTHGRNAMAARSLWRATGMGDDGFGKPIIAIANSFTEFVPGHVHLRNLGMLVAEQIQAAGGVARNSIRSPSMTVSRWATAACSTACPRANSSPTPVEYMVNAHCADAIVCMSNCDKITPGMLLAVLRLNVPAIFVTGGPMESGMVTIDNVSTKIDLVTGMSSLRR